jgi:hypothetical protein
MSSVIRAETKNVFSIFAKNAKIMGKFVAFSESPKNFVSFFTKIFNYFSPKISAAM